MRVSRVHSMEPIKFKAHSFATVGFLVCALAWCVGASPCLRQTSGSAVWSSHEQPILDAWFETGRAPVVARSAGGRIAAVDAVCEPGGGRIDGGGFPGGPDAVRLVARCAPVAGRRCGGGQRSGHAPGFCAAGPAMGFADQHQCEFSHHGPGHRVCGARHGAIVGGHCACTTAQPSGGPQGGRARLPSSWA